MSNKLLIGLFISGISLVYSGIFVNNQAVPSAIRVPQISPLAPTVTIQPQASVLGREIVRLDFATPTPSGEPKEEAVAEKLYVVTRVVDGDTIEIEGGKKVRYIGMDTPEIHHPKKPVECFGQEAYEVNKSMVEGKNVKLEKDVSETDRYGRLLRYVSVDGVMVNDYLVRQGYAYASTYPPDVKYQDQFRQAQQEARENKKGLWNSCK